MKASVLQESLSAALSLASRFVSPRPQLPVLANILLSAQKGRLKISATNLETGITIWVGAKIEKEGAITVPARLITETVAGFPPERLELEEKEGSLTTSSANLAASFLTLPASEFPPISDSLPKEGITLGKKFLEEICGQVVFAASGDETKPILSGVLFAPQNGKFEIVATDGFRLSKKETGKVDVPKNIIVPARAIGELARIFPPEAEKIGFWVSEKENQVIFGTDEVVLTTRVLEGEFPDYGKIIPTDFLTKVTLEKEAFLQAVKLAAIFAREAANVVKLKITKEQVTLFAESPAAGRQEARLEGKKEGEDLEISFNWRFLADFLGAVTADVVEIKFNGPAAPALFCDPKDPSFVHLIMPIRIQS